MSFESEFIECSICMNQYDFKTPSREARLLPCTHSLCTGCLAKITKNVNNSQRITCPFCSKQLVLNESDVIPVNKYINAYLKATTSERDSGVGSTISSTSSSSMTSTASSLPSVSLQKKVVTQPTNYEASERQENKPKPSWNEAAYLRKIFNDIDESGDGQIQFNELSRALEKGAQQQNFNIKTVFFLFKKYDTDNNGLISFEEFQSLFQYLNLEFERFICADTNSNGSIDAKELINALKNRISIKFTPEFYKFIEKGYEKDLTFDDYLRLVARFDYLCVIYKNDKQLEQQLKKSLFDDNF